MQKTIIREMIWKKVSFEAIPKNSKRWSITIHICRGLLKGIVNDLIMDMCRV